MGRVSPGAGTTKVGQYNELTALGGRATVKCATGPAAGGLAPPCIVVTTTTAATGATLSKPDMSLARFTVLSTTLIAYVVFPGATPDEGVEGRRWGWFMGPIVWYSIETISELDPPRETAAATLVVTTVVVFAPFVIGCVGEVDRTVGPDVPDV